MEVVEKETIKEVPSEYYHDKYHKEYFQFLTVNSLQKTKTKRKKH